MKRALPGFSVFFVLILVSAFSIAAISYVRINGFLISLSKARETHEYQYWACRGLQQYALALMQAKSEIPTDIIVINSWPHDGALYQGTIQFVQNEIAIIGTVQLKKQQKVVQEMSFLIKK